jgi:sugar transferase (PEP-CTERM system associated)
MALDEIFPKRTLRDAEMSGTHVPSLSEKLSIGSGALLRDAGRDSPPSVESEFVPFARARGLFRRTPTLRSAPHQAPAHQRGPRQRLPKFWPSLGAVLYVLDLLLMVTAQAVVFGVIRERLALSEVPDVFLVVILSTLTTLTLSYASGCYQPHTLVNHTAATARVPVAIGLGCGVFFLELHYVLAVLLPSHQVFLSISRCITIGLLGAGISLFAAIAARIAFYAMVHRQWFRRRILVVGTGQRALRLCHLMAQDAQGIVNDLQFVSEAIIGGKMESPSAELAGAVVFGEHSIDQLARKLVADEIVVAVDERRGLTLDGLLACKRLGIPVTDYNTFVEREIGRVDLGCLEMSWLVYSNGFRMHAVDVLNKRCVDILVSLFLLFASSPFLLAAIVAIWVEGYEHIWFKQERITQDGRRFWLYKLRTMRPDAESNGAQWASENDPRVTRVGAILRRTRIDEIPQLINVLRGDMSLVGPRPERPMFVAELSQDVRMYNLRHSVKSGLTGWAQISYRYGASRADALRKLEYDLYYIKNYSLLRDLAIILQTLRVLIWPPGVR